MHIENTLGWFGFRYARSPAQLVSASFQRGRAVAGSSARAQHPRITAGMRAGRTSAQRGLGAVDWGSILSNVATTAVNYRVSTLNASRAEAEERLRQARESAAMAEQVKAAQVIPAKKSAALPIMPLAIGGLALAGAAFFLLRKKR